jgi:VanZ family protein
MKRYIFYHLPWQIMMIAIFIQSSIGNIELPDLYINWSDKLLHFLGFGVLAFFIARSLVRVWPGRYIILTLIISMLYAASDEVHQYFVQGRSATFGDWLADTLGIILFTTLYCFFLSRRKILLQPDGDQK